MHGLLFFHYFQCSHINGAVCIEHRINWCGVEFSMKKSCFMHASIRRIEINQNWHTLFDIYKDFAPDTGSLKHNRTIILWCMATMFKQSTIFAPLTLTKFEYWTHSVRIPVCSMQPNQSSNFSRFSDYNNDLLQRKARIERVNIVFQLETEPKQKKKTFGSRTIDWTIVVKQFQKQNQNKQDVKDWSVRLVIDWL